MDFLVSHQGEDVKGAEVGLHDLSLGIASRRGYDRRKSRTPWILVKTPIKMSHVMGLVLKLPFSRQEWHQDGTCNWELLLPGQESR